MNTRAGRIVSGLGSIAAVVCFFLPWVRSALITAIIDIIKPITAWLYPNLKDTVELIGRAISLSGLKMAFGLPLITTPFRLLVLLPLVLGVLALVWLLIAASGSFGGARVVDLIQALLCIVAAAVLFFSRTYILHLGIESPLLWSAMSWLGFRMGWGFWGSLVALVLIALGMALGVSDTSADGHLSI